MPRVKLEKPIDDTLKKLIIANTKPPELEDLPEPEPIGPLKDIVGDSFCHNIRGDVKRGAWLMCGHPKKEGQNKSWCAWHHKRIYQPDKIRR